MNFFEIDEFLKTVPWLNRCSSIDGEDISYIITTESYLPDMNDGKPYINEARAILLNSHGIYCLELRDMNGCLFARNPVEVSNLTQLKAYLDETHKTVVDFEKRYKIAQVNLKIEKANEDFK
jgi:hypothetical protein